MGNLVSSGWIGLTHFVIVPDSEETSNKHDTIYDATVSTPTETFEAKTNGWESAMKWVDSTIKKIQERNNESERDY